MYDYVIVGAGSAGCVLAARLSENPAHRVLLLEAGPPDKKIEIHVPAAFAKVFKTERDWAYETAPQPGLGGRRLFWPRGKTLGGSSSINAQMWVRGNPADYDEWAALGNAGWGYEDVLGYFRRSEHHERGPAAHRGQRGPLRISDLRDPNPTTHAFVRAAVEAGLERNVDVNDGEQDGVDYTQVNQRRGRRWSAADGYLRPARRRRNLTVHAGALVRRVVIEDGRAVGVEVERGGQRETVTASREVMLSGGAINSPQLLMLSGIGPGQHLCDHGIDVVCDVPGVGQNLRDHLVVGLIVTSREPVTLFAAESRANLVKYLVRRKGMLTSNVGEACAFVRTRPDLAAPDLELLFAPVPFIDHGLVPPTGHGMTIGAVALQPRSVGEVTLRSADPLEPVDIDPRCLSDAEGDDLRVLVDGMKLARRIFDAPAMAPYVGDPLEPAARVDDDDGFAAHVREQAETLYHPVGTCKMGNDENAVVDSELRVRGVGALRVVDASVMPTIVRGHTHAPTVMIAEKASELIRSAASPPAPPHGRRSPS